MVLASRSANILKYIAKAVSLAAVYFFAAKFGLGLNAVSGFAAPVWPPTGIAIASLLIFGIELWPGILLGAFAVNLYTGISHGLQIETAIVSSIGIGIGNALEGFLGSYALRRVGFIRSFERLKNALWFILLTSLAATAVSATLGVTSLLLTKVIDSSAYSGTWIAWWVGDVLGALVVAPLLVTWSTPPRRYFGLSKAVEAAILFSVTTVVGLFVFMNLFHLSLSIATVTYLIFPPLIWAAVRFDQYGGTLGVFIVSILAIFGTASQLGPFASSDLSQSLILLQSFIATVAITTLIIGAVIAERERDEAEIKNLSEGLEEKVRERSSALIEAQTISSIGSWEWDIPTDVVEWSNQMYKTYNLKPGRDEITYEKFLDMVHPDDRARVKEIVDGAFKSHEPFEFYHRIVRSDGLVRTLQARGQVVTDKSGVAVRMYGTAQDVTEEKAASDALKARTEELERLNKFMVDREVAMTELKKKIESLEKKS